MNITVINIHRDSYRGIGYVYIGRSAHHDQHYGNPFTHLQGHTRATIRVATRELAVEAYEDWLRGNWRDVEPQRRAWILRQIEYMAVSGKDLTLGCFCAPKGGFKNEHTCHGQVLKRIILEKREEIERWRESQTVSG